MVFRSRAYTKLMGLPFEEEIASFFLRVGALACQTQVCSVTLAAHMPCRILLKTCRERTLIHSRPTLYLSGSMTLVALYFHEAKGNHNLRLDSMHVFPLLSGKCANPEVGAWGHRTIVTNLVPKARV